MKQYFWNLLLVIDEAFNTLSGGDPGETISSRAGKAMQKGERWACVLCRFLNLFQKDHCIKSIEPAEGSRAVVED